MAPTREEEKQHDREGFEKRQAAKSGQSGSGRGTIGPGSRDSSKYAQTMAERHGITKGQKRQTEEDDDRRVVREEGQVSDGAEDLENLSGERQKNVMHHREQGNDEALVGHTNNAEHATQAAQAAQSLLSTPEVLFAFKPDRPDRLSRARATKIAYDVVRSTSAAGPSMIIPFRPLNERIAAPAEGRITRPRGETASLDRLAQAKADKEDRDVVMATHPHGETASQAGISHKHCANCGGNGHLLVNCITAEHGSIKVCVFCRTKNHLTDECQSFKKLGLAAKVRLLVKDRAGKPELATRRGWWRYLHDFLVSEETKGVPVPTAFPWSPKFAESLFDGKWTRTIGQIQEEVDRTWDASKLPKDETMQSLKDVYTRHWREEKLPWPRRRLGRMSSNLDMGDLENLRQNDPRPAAYYEALSKYNGWKVCDFSDEEEE
ncbi:hypothetical protein FPRO06_09844 [Fusarium proliferatum]|nr:hypothetical protein FPRO06_09844 [Fusarium proliferatum]